MFPEKLLLLNVIVRKNKAGSLLAKLLNTGFFHPVDATSLYGFSEIASRLKSDFESSKWKEIEKTFNQILNETGFTGISPSYSPASFNETQGFLLQIEEEIMQLVDEKNRIQKEIDRLNELLQKKPVYAGF